MWGTSILLALRGIWGGIPGGVKMGAVVALVGAAVLGGAFLYGRSAGRDGAAVDALETSVKILRERNRIDETISHADAAALCRDYGLPGDQIAECVRRVVGTDTKP